MKDKNEESLYYSTAYASPPPPHILEVIKR